jgi:hypothetical protein
MPLFKNRTKKVQIILRNESRSKSKSKSRSNSFTRKRNLIATRFVSKLNSYKSKVLERSNKSRALTQKLKTKLNSAITIIKKSDKCPICLSKIDLKESITTLQCGHTLHSRCLYKYVNNTQDVGLRCPSCREPIKLTSLDPSKLKPELLIKFLTLLKVISDDYEENMNRTKAMWDDSCAYVIKLNEDIANNPALEVVLRRILTKANEARNEAHDMYNDALSLYITAYEKYLTYKSIYNIDNIETIDNIDNTRQIV